MNIQISSARFSYMAFLWITKRQEMSILSDVERNTLPMQRRENDFRE